MGRVFNRNTKSINDIIKEFRCGALRVDDGYQRKKVWTMQDNVRFIETILLDMIIPEVFFWTADVDAATGEAVVHIVDGQQRINAIADFVAGKYRLRRQFLLNGDADPSYADKDFDGLSPEERKAFWQYPVPIVSIDRECTRASIIEIFKRLNLTEYSLNSQERRHSDENNSFGAACEQLAELEFWDEMKIFSPSDLKRMGDVRYCCTIFILADRGIVDQADDTAINRYYSDNSSDFDSDGSLQCKVEEAMELIRSWSNDSTVPFTSKKAQLYTLFSLALYCIEKDIEEVSLVPKRLARFVTAYSLFKNTVDYEDAFSEEQVAFDSVKRYKLASSEGVNKGSNRAIRFNVLKKVCLACDLDEEMVRLVEGLAAKD